MFEPKQSITKKQKFSKNLILRKLIILQKKPDISNKQPLRKITPKSLDELANYKQYYWYWIGEYNNEHKPIYRKVYAHRYLYNYFQTEIPTKWKLRPLCDLHPHWDVNPWKFELANNYEKIRDQNDINEELTEDLKDLMDMIPQYFPKPTTLEDLYNGFNQQYSKEDIEQTCKLLARTIPLS